MSGLLASGSGHMFMASLATKNSTLIQDIRTLFLQNILVTVQKCRIIVWIAESLTVSSEQVDGYF